MRLIQPWLISSPYFPIFANMQSCLLENSTNEFIHVIVQKPILFYVKNKTIITNNSYISFENYLENLLTIGDIYSFIILYNLPSYVQTNFEIHWIVCEGTATIDKSNMISFLCFLDLFLERGGKNTVGRIDYEKLLSLLNETAGTISLNKFYKHKNCNNFFSCIFKIFLSKKKNKYATEKDILEIEVENTKSMEKYKQYVFRPVCPVCKETKSIVLYDSLMGKKYDKPDDFIRYIRKNKEVYAVLICKSCRNVSPEKLIFVRQIDHFPKTNVEKNRSFIWVYKKYIEVEDGGFSALITDKIIASIGVINDAK